MACLISFKSSSEESNCYLLCIPVKCYHKFENCKKLGFFCTMFWISFYKLEIIHPSYVTDEHMQSIVYL